MKKTAKRILSDITGIPEYRMDAVGGEFITKEGALKAMDEIVNQKEEEMHLNMQYYMEFCQSKGYVTPQAWIKHHKHF